MLLILPSSLPMSSKRLLLELIVMRRKIRPIIFKTIVHPPSRNEMICRGDEKLREMETKLGFAEKVFVVIALRDCYE